MKSIQPVILYPGWFVSPQPKGTDVWVLNKKALLAFLEKEPSILSSEDVHALAAHLERYVRNA
ncbi:MAG: hypothetical protein EPN94_01010 [Nitrospirae bacterium]|nr:MAG: hypothetical protein EPN94_01010 [Nitrospirota bacterium]